MERIDIYVYDHRGRDAEQGHDSKTGQWERGDYHTVHASHTPPGGEKKISSFKTRTEYGSGAAERKIREHLTKAGHEVHEIKHHSYTPEIKREDPSKGKQLELSAQGKRINAHLKQKWL